MIYLITHPEKQTGPDPEFSARGWQQAYTITNLMNDLQNNQWVGIRNFRTIIYGDAKRYFDLARMICEKLGARHVRIHHSTLLGDNASSETGDDGVSVMTFEDVPRQLHATHLGLESEYFDAPRWIKEKMDYPYQGDKLIITNGRFARLLGLEGGSGSVYELHLDNKPPEPLGKLLLHRGALYYA